MIEVAGVVFEYPGTRALDGVSFSLPKASITALVGPNGAGKTTLLRCLAVLDQPYAGSILIDGVDVFHHPREVHRRVGYLPDNFGLYADLPIEKCLKYAGLARGLTSPTLDKRIPEVIGQLGLGEKLGETAGTLSRGQRQRLAIAQAIIHRPAALLLDEPASGLDPESRSALAGLMRALRDDGMTLVVSSHILSELEEYCTGMLVLQQGRVIEHRRIEQSTPARTRRLRIRLSRPSPDLAAVLQEVAGVAIQPGDDSEATFSFNGDDDALAEALRTCVARGLQVCELVPLRGSLQDAYLQAVAGARGQS